MGHMHISVFGRNFNTLANALAARERLQNVYAANIANADTPHYHADRRDFASFLAERQSASAGGASKGVALARTRPEHFSAGNDDAGDGIGHVPLFGHHARNAQRLDGNDVDLQKEMAAMSKNQLMHELTLRLLKNRLDGMANIAREGGR